MNQEFVRGARVDQDLEDIYVFIGRDSIEAADRLLSAAETTFRRIAVNPEIGPVCRFRNRRLAGLRSWRIAEFPKYLVFYRVLPAGVEIVRVIHGARNLARRLIE